MRDGGVLGFNTRYSYTIDLQCTWADLLVNIKFIADKTEVITKLQQCPIQKFINKSHNEQQYCLSGVGITGTDMEKVLHVVSDPTYHPRLKGADYIIFYSAKLLGLPVHIKPLLMSIPDKHMNLALTDDSDDFHTLDIVYEASSKEVVYKLFGPNLCQYTQGDITWCQQPRYNQPAGVAGYCPGRSGFDQEAHLDLWYKDSFILIGIPKWSECRQQLVTMSVSGQETTMEPGTSVKILDNVEGCFQRYKCSDKEQYLYAPGYW